MGTRWLRKKSEFVTEFKGRGGTNGGDEVLRQKKKKNTEQIQNVNKELKRRINFLFDL